MRVLVTGAEGFLGKNAVVRLGEEAGIDVLPATRSTSPGEWNRLLLDADAVLHLAGVNRPSDPKDFKTGNTDLTDQITSTLSSLGKAIPIVFSSSTQAELDNEYGVSKRLAEQMVFAYSERSGAPCYVYRLPNAFGKWCKPNYNSAVATFCHNIAHGLPTKVNDPAAALTLVYVDDVVDEFLRALKGESKPSPECSVSPVYSTTVGQVADTIAAFKTNRDTLMIDRVGVGLMRALYSTYLSYLPEESFSYRLPVHADARGVFSEMLKTADSGQFSFFTAHPGITRGGHYHHTKTEKFLVVKGKACFRFRHIVTDQFVQIETDAASPTVVETIPGWSHDITNTSDEEMIVLLWANEIFDRQRPDTITQFVA